MRERYGAPAGRAAVALAMSVALHLAVLGAWAPLLGTFLAVAPELGTPLIVDVVAEEARPAAPPTAARMAGRDARPPRPISLPPIIPIATEEEPAPPASGVSPVALEIASPEATAQPPAPPTAEAVAESSQAAVPSPPETREAATAVRPEETAHLSQSAPPVPDADSATPAPDPRVNLARLDEVARNPSVAARAEGQPFVGRRDVFEFLLDHPDFATHITRALRLARYRMWRTDDGLFMDDGWGATGQVFVVHADRGRRVLYARGAFQSRLLPAIQGEAVVTINYDVQPAGDGRDVLFAAISSQLKIAGIFGDLVATLANAVATEKAEKESRRMVQLFARVLRAIDEMPAALYASLRERPDVPQRELEQFRALLNLP
jgi:hypothetical protein